MNLESKVSHMLAMFMLVIGFIVYFSSGMLRTNEDEIFLKTLIQTLVFPRLDYCNSVLANLPVVGFHHPAARLIRNLTMHDPVSPLMMTLHWLLATLLQNNIQVWLMYYYGAHYNTGTKYQKNLVNTTSSLSGRLLVFCRISVYFRIDLVTPAPQICFSKLFHFFSQVRNAHGMD